MSKETNKKETTSTEDFEALNFLSEEEEDEGVKAKDKKTGKKGTTLQRLINYEDAKTRLPKIKEHLNVIEESIEEINDALDRISIAEQEINDVVPNKDYSHKTAQSYTIMIEKITALTKGESTISHKELIAKVYGVNKGR